MARGAHSSVVCPSLQTLVQARAFEEPGRKENWTLFPLRRQRTNRIGANQACTVLSAKVYYVTNIICFGKSWNIPTRPGRPPCAPPPRQLQGCVLPHPCSHLVSGHPVNPAPRAPQNFLRPDPLSPHPFLRMFGPARASEHDIGLTSIVERYRSVRGSNRLGAF